MVLDKAAGTLSLIAGADDAGGVGKPAFVGRRLRHHAAEYTTRLSFAPEHEGDFAGLLGFMDESHFVTLGEEGPDIVVRRRAGTDDPERGAVIGRIARPGSGKVELRLSFDGGRASAFARQADRPQWQTVAADFDVELLASIHGGLFTGLVVGPYAVSAPVSQPGRE